MLGDSFLLEQLKGTLANKFLDAIKDVAEDVMLHLTSFLDDIETIVDFISGIVDQKEVVLPFMFISQEGSEFSQEDCTEAEGGNIFAALLEATLHDIASHLTEFDFEVEDEDESEVQCITEERWFDAADVDVPEDNLEFLQIATTYLDMLYTTELEAPRLRRLKKVSFSLPFSLTFKMNFDFVEIDLLFRADSRTSFPESSHDMTLTSTLQQFVELKYGRAVPSVEDDVVGFFESFGKLASKHLISGPFRAGDVPVFDLEMTVQGGVLQRHIYIIIH